MTTTATYQEERIHVRDTGIQLLRAGTGPPLLYLHGAGGAGLWSPGIAELAESFTVYQPSHPGFGTSDWPEWLDGIDDVVLHYLDLIEVLGLDRPHLAGSSLGGWIAAELAVAHSDKIGRLVLANAAGLPVEGAVVPDIFLMTPEQTARLLYFDPDLAEQMAARAAQRTPDQIAQANRDRAATARLAWQPYLYNPKLARRLARIRAATLVLWGANDGLFPPSVGAEYARRIPGARLEIIDRCGHSPQVERPLEFSRLVRSFLSA